MQTYFWVFLVFLCGSRTGNFHFAEKVEEVEEDDVEEVEEEEEDEVEEEEVEEEEEEVLESGGRSTFTEHATIFGPDDSPAMVTVLSIPLPSQHQPAVLHEILIPKAGDELVNPDQETARATFVYVATSPTNIDIPFRPDY